MEPFRILTPEGHLLAEPPLGLDETRRLFAAMVTARTYAASVLTVFVAATFSGLVVRRMLDRLDLVAVLKTRE